MAMKIQLPPNPAPRNIEFDKSVVKKTIKALPGVYPEVELAVHTEMALKRPQATVSIIDSQYDTVKKTATLVMPNMGDDLCEYLEKGRGSFSLSVVLLNLLILSEALHFLHNVLGFTHGDLTCENLLVDHTNRLLKMTDFGLAAKINPKCVYTRRGKTHYMPPEMWNVYLQYADGVVYDWGKADVFSLGVCAFVMLFGHFPFQRADILTDPHYRAIAKNGVFAMMKDDTVPASVYALLDGMMCHDHTKRYTMRQVYEACLAFFV